MGRDRPEGLLGELLLCEEVGSADHWGRRRAAAATATLTSATKWWSRNWKWALPFGCLLPMLLCGGVVMFAFAIYSVVVGSMKSSDAYEVGMASEARANPGR